LVVVLGVVFIKELRKEEENLIAIAKAIFYFGATILYILFINSFSEYSCFEYCYQKANLI